MRRLLMVALLVAVGCGGSVADPVALSGPERKTATSGVVCPTADWRNEWSDGVQVVDAGIRHFQYCRWHCVGEYTTTAGEKLEDVDLLLEWTRVGDSPVYVLTSETHSPGCL